MKYSPSYMDVTIALQNNSKNTNYNCYDFQVKHSYGIGGLCKRRRFDYA